MRPIDADALVEAIKDYPYGFRGMIVCDIAKQPTIEPKDGCEYWDGESGFCALHRPADLVKHGEWITKKDACGIGYQICSNCETEIQWRDRRGVILRVDMQNAPYCPYCGAKMFAKDIDVPNKERSEE